MTTTSTEFQLPRMRMVARQAVLRHLRHVPIGTRLPPMEELARELGLGRCNLQVAMKELAREGLLVSRPKRGTFVARQSREPKDQRAPAIGTSQSDQPMALPGPMGHILAGKRISLLTEDFTEPMLLGMVRAAAQTLTAAGAQVSERPLIYRPDSGAEPVDACDLAVIFNPVLPQSRSLNIGVPMVVASTSWHESFFQRTPCDMIGVDQFGGARLAGEMLRQSGFTEACFIGVKPRIGPAAYEPISALRLRGFEAGFGKPVAEEHQLNSFGFSLDGGARGFRRYTRQSGRPRAIFAATDEIAVGFIIAAESQSMYPGRNFHIVGFDGQRLGRQLTGGPLTTVDVPVSAMGHTAAEVAIQRLLRPDRPSQITYLTCQLHQGATVVTHQNSND